MLKASNVSTESYWPSLFAKLSQNKNIEDLILNAGGGGAAVAVAAPAAGGAGAAAAAPAVEEKKVKGLEYTPNNIENALRLLM